jgi:hypothetical protein
MLDDTLIAQLAAELQQSQTTRVQVEHFLQALSTA